MLLLLSLPGEGSEIRYGRGGSQTAPTIDGSRIAPTSFSYSSAGVAKAGFSYSHWLSTGQPAANEDWTSGTFVLRPTASDIYNSRLSAAWRNAGTRAADIQALLRDELLLSANGKENNWQASWQNHREAALRGLIDGTSDALLGKALEEGRALSWVRRLDVDFRTSLRDRPGSFGIDAILALHESTDDATGLQLRGFFGNDLKGANAGLFYRHATGNSLLGGNVFLDYENIDDGGAFWRWSLGGEWRSPYVELTGNRYIGITEGKRSSDGDYLYTADGTEIELALRVPQAPWLSGVLSYYEWDGEYGDDEDTGLRYGIRVDRNFKGLSFEVEYEDPEEGEGVWGGRIAYSHDFGKGLESAAATEALTFDPRANFFDAVRREYTQRIRNAGNVFTGRIVITRVDGRATLIGTDQTLTLFGTGANFTADLSGEPRQIITTPNSYTVTATALVMAFTESPATLRISANNWEIELHSELVFSFDSFTVILRDGELAVLRNDGGISVISLANGRPVLNLANALISVAIDGTVSGGAVSLQLDGGLASLVLNADNTLSALVRSGTLIVSLAANSSIAVSVESLGDDGEVILLSGGVTTNISPLAGLLAASASAVVTIGYTGQVAQVTATGGGNIRYTLISGGGAFAVGATNGLLSLTLAQSNPVTLTAGVQISDAGTLGVKATPITVSYTVLVGEELRFLPEQAVTIITYDNNRALHTASAVGQLGAVRYALISVVPANLEGRFTVFADGGVVSVLQPLTTPITLSLYIRASENISGEDRSATLLLTVAAVDPPAFAALLDDSNPAVTIGYNGLVARINSTGGSGTHTYTFQSGGNNFVAGADGRISLLVARTTPTALAAVGVANDGHPNTPPVTLSLTLNILNVLGFTPSRLSLRLTTHDSVPTALYTAAVVDSLGSAIIYSLLSTAPANFTANINFTPSNRVLSLTATLTTPVDTSIYILATTAAAKATLTLQLEVVNPPAINAALASASAFFLTGETGKVASVTVTGGAGAYAYAVGSGFAVGIDGLLTLTPAQSNAATLTATVVVNDAHANTAPVNLSLTLTLVEPVSFSPDKAAFTLTTHDSVPLTLYQADLQGGLGTPAYALVSTAPSNFGGNVAVNSGGDIILNQLLSSPITASVYVRGQAATFGGTATLLLTVIAVDPPAFAAALDNSAPVLITGGNGLVASINSTGGKGTRIYTIQPTGGNLTVGTDGRITLLTAVATPTTLSATVVSNDGHPNTPPVTLSLTLRIVNALGFAPVENISLTTYGSSVPTALHTAVAINPLGGAITYLLLSTAPANFTANINFTPTNGIVSLTAELTSPLDASVYIRATTPTEKATLVLRLAVIDPPALAATLVNASAFFLTGEIGKVASVTVTGGAGTYTYVVGSGFAVGTDGLLTLTPAQSNAATLTATVVVNDTHANTNPVSVSLTLTLAQPVSFSPTAAAVTLTTHDSVPATLHQADLQGGLGAEAYALVSTAPIGFSVNVSIDSDNGRIILTQTLSPPVTASVYVRGQAATFGGTATLLLTVIAVNPPAFAAALDNSAPVLITGGNGLVASINSTGGKGTRIYTIQPTGGNLTVGTDGRITLLTAVATPTTLSATVVSNDGHPNTPPVTLSLTLRIVNALGFAPVENISLTTYGSSVPTALHTAVAINPLGGAITYLLLSTAPANFTANINFTPTNGIVSLTAELTSPLDASVYIRATTPTEKATLVLRLAVIDPPALAATLVNASAFFLTGEIGKVASVTVTGGAGTYTYVVGSGFAVGTDGLLTLTPAQSNAATLTATVVVNDTHANTNPVSVSLTLTLAQPVSFSPTAAAVTLTTHDSVPATLHQADLQGGLGAEAYALVSTAPIGFSVNVSIDSDNGRIILTQTLSPPVTASVYVRGQAATFGGTATLLLTVIAVNPPAFAAALDNSAPVLTTGNKGLVAQVNSTGGKGAHTYTIQPVGGNLTVGTDGRITLLTAAVMQTILSATLVANDGHPNTPPVTLSLTLLIHGVPAFANASAVVLTGYTGAVASIVNAPSGGFTVIFGGDNFTVSTDGELSLTMAITVSSTLTASVLVDDGTQTVTLGYILNVGLCSFFGGCQPFVNYDGAGGGTAGLNTWVSLSVTMAQALIAAGADVNEALTYTINANNYGVDRPLFAVSRYGSFAVASVLLANNADANTVIQYTEDSATFSNVGILFGAFYRAPTNLDVVPLASLFVTHGADVNHKTGFTGLVTPLDIYNFRAGSNTAASGNAHAQAAVLIKGFGAKCFGVCRNGNGDIRLAAVSFVPTAVVVRTTMTGDLYTVQTYSGLGTRFNYRVVSTFPVGFASNYSVLSVDVNSAILNLNSSQDFGQTISVFIEATDNNSTTGKATLRYIQIIPAPSFVSASVTVLFNYTGRVASITNAPPASGFTVVSGNANFTVGTDGALSLTATILVSSTLTASVLVDDGSQSTTLGYTLRVRSTEPSFVNASVAVLFSYTGQVASITNAPPSSGFSVAFGAANFTIGADGVLSLTTTSAVTTTLTASVVIDASPLLPMTLGYTLNVAACSFFIPGCQPFVNFDGARAGGADSVLNHPGRVAWAAINAPLAQSLIAAGANINEVSSADNDTPLLAVARYGNPAVASVLLTAGANVNAVGRYDENASSNSTIMFSNVGVLEYIKLNATNINPLVSLFVDYGVSVNLRVSINDNANLTPLDYFNTRGYTLAASIIESAGAKCAIHCQTGNLRFASVAFSEGVVSVTVADTDTGDIYTVQAASGLGTQLNYQLLSVSPVSLSASFSAVSVDVNSAKLNLDPALGSGRPTALTVYVEATDNNTTTDKATLQIKIVE